MILFLLSKTKLYLHIVTLSAKGNLKLSKSFSKGVEKFVYWNECKIKNKNRITTNEYRYFPE